MSRLVPRLLLVALTLAPACLAATAPREATPERRVPPKAYILYAAGIQLQQQDKHAEAIARLEEALKLDPKSASILHGIGYSYYRLSKNDEAVDYLKRSLALDPENGPAHETLAFVHAAATRRDEALKELEAAARSKRRPSSHESLVRRIAWIYEQQRDFAKAAEWYQYLLDCGYRRADVYQSLAGLQLQLKRFADALESFRQVVVRAPSDKAAVAEIAQAFAGLNDADRDEAIRQMEAAVEKHGDVARREVLAMAYKAAGRRDDMLAQLERIAADTSRRAETQRRYLAEYYEQLGDLPKAIEWRRRLIDERAAPSATDHVRLASLYLKHEQMPLAAATFRKAAELEPRRRDLLRRVADCHAVLYHWGEAAAALKEYLDGEEPLEPKHATALYELGELYHRAGNDGRAAPLKARAFKLLTDAIGKPGGTLSDSQLHLLVAELYYADDKPQKALDYLLIARRLDPKDPKKTLLAAAGHKRVQQWKEAADAYRQFLAEDQASLGAAGALFELARCQDALGDRAGAIVSHEKAKQILVKAGRGAERDEAKAAVEAQLGEIDLRDHKPKDAIQHLQEAVRLNPQDALPLLMLAQSYQALADWTRAAAYFKTYFDALKGDLDASHARTLFQLGVAQARSGQGEAGRTSKDRAIQLLLDELATLEKEQRGTPATQADLLRDLAGLYSADKQHPKAIDAITRAIALAPDAVRTDYRLTLAAIHDDTKSYEESEKVLVAAREADPDDAGVLNHLAYHYAVRGIKLDEAARLVTRALHLDPLNGAYIDTLGWVYYRQGKFEQALAELVRATRYERDGVILDHAGDAHLKLGNILEAREAWTQAIALDPDIEGVADKLRNHKAPPKPKDPPKPKPAPKPEPIPKPKPDPKPPDMPDDPDDNG